MREGGKIGSPAKDRHLPRYPVGGPHTDLCVPDRTSGGTFSRLHRRYGKELRSRLSTAMESLLYEDDHYQSGSAGRDWPAPPGDEHRSRKGRQGSHSDPFPPRSHRWTRSLPSYQDHRRPAILRGVQGTERESGWRCPSATLAH